MTVRITSFRTSLLCVFLFLSSVVPQSLLAAGPGSIKGRVLDSSTGDPLPGASVIVENTSIGAATDRDGKYVIQGVPVGNQTIRVSYVGYVTTTADVTVTEDGTMEREFRLVAQAIEGETVVVTAQARGQQAAINQQLSSNTITNIVSAARIKELPDASAAESIGRLPGISIDRYNGEATAVAIRGLAPKYNTVTVNGVTLPATNNNDRSVDLSLISSNLLDGIEVKKANTPDMDADALGGTIDLRLREAPQGFQVAATAQGGYNQLENYYGNYNVNVNLSDRFLDDDLGIIAGLNTDRNNRSANKLNASYTLNVASGATASNIRTTNLILERDDAFKNRLGGNILADYRIPFGKVTANGFYSQGKTDGTTRQDNMDFNHVSHYFYLQSNTSTTSIYTSSAGLAQDFGWIKYDAGFSATGSKTDDPNDYRWQFSQENNAGAPPPAGMPLDSAYSFETVNDSITGLQYLFVNSARLIENQKSGQFNFQLPFQLTDDINGYVKFGGKYRGLTRTFDQNQVGHGNLQYGTVWTGVVGTFERAAAQMYPNDFNVARDSANIVDRNLWNLYYFYNGYKPPSDFLEGKYQFQKSPDERLLRLLTNAAQTTGRGNWQIQPLSSYGNDYDGIERYDAAYIMSEIKIGPYVTFTPGVRYDEDYTKYHGQSFREVTQAGSAQIPSLQLNENVRRNTFWLPMVHLNVVPFEWLHVHLAATETVSRPDYNMYAPISTIDQYSSNVQAANGSLRDSRSKNLDASISIYENYIGFMNISGFYKQIDDLIMYQGITQVDTTIYKLLNANLNIPNGWLTGSQQVNTWVNNATPAQYRGVEFDWQTHFWYLPSVLQGLIFNLNWTYIVSTIDVKQYLGSSRRVFVPPHTQLTQRYLDSTSRTQRMPDQPAHIFNTTIGYDYGGFSIRVSYLYQSDKVTGVGNVPLTDAFTAAYGRWDIAVQQKLADNIQLYANLNNLNNTHDESLLGYQQINPTSLQYYGRTIDAGVRVNF